MSDIVKNILRKLKKNDLGVRLILALVFWLCLTLFLHFKQIKLDVIDLHSNSNRYVVSQINFDYPDDEATILSKQKKIADINSIYFIDAKQIKLKRINFENYLIDNPKWKNLPSISYEKMNDLVDRFENTLIASRFSDAKTIKRMKNHKIDITNYIALNHEHKKEFPLPKGYFSIFAKKLENVPEKTLDFMENYFEKNDYKLTLDYLTLSKVKKLIAKNVAQKYSHISAGELIIGSNEKVTTKHLAIMQAMKAALAKNRNLFEPLTILGNILMSFVFISLALFYLRLEQPKILKSIKQLSLIFIILILTLLSAKIMEFVLLKSTSSFVEATRYPIIVPFAALLFSILFNMRISLFFSAVLCIVVALSLAVEHTSFLTINLVTSLIVIVATKCMRKRTEVFIVCAKCMLGVIPIILASSFIKNRLFHLTLLTNITSSVFFLVIIGIMVVGLLPVLETIFDVLTDITLMEYMDPNNELLRRITLEIPGSYQHSLVLGNLAEAAAQEIHANALFCRVATLYHDIGKLTNPNYFIENQGSGVNIHQLLTPVESAEVIISHVTGGEMLAKKYRLPKQIIDIIKQHHGTTLVYYFYRKEMEIKEEIDQIDEVQFRYPGPKPRSKEAAIIMIADAMEAAARSLEEITEEILSSLINKVVKNRTDDGQFDECSLTFEEMKIVKKSIVRTLLLTRHSRIKYPEQKQEKLRFYLESYLADKSV
ncbi:MAG: Cyclic-di-AMP phosphodiesterase PgpH [Candidatus Anoxychlamydiales bacterium]|nr:Cyclic-di-AMP phosphodiesterase PgpH [Candidatus Anoxychlamydiales bacterium]